MFVFLILGVLLAGSSAHTVRDRNLQRSPTAIFSITEVLQSHAPWLIQTEGMARGPICAE